MLILSATMCNERIYFRQFLRMRLTLISGFGVNLNPLTLFISIKHRGLNLPSRISSWSSFKRKSSPLVLSIFPRSNIWIWREVSIGGMLPLHLSMSNAQFKTLIQTSGGCCMMTCNRAVGGDVGSQNSPF